MWERVCSRTRCISQPIRRLTPRFREQARSHTETPASAGSTFSYCRYRRSWFLSGKSAPRSGSPR
ncbi:hypothetical protein C0058_19655 [Pseudomonas sp. NC02]|nr:hypothetical protein C0058_19655 [Pseudomonas sp. NC02]